MEKSARGHKKTRQQPNARDITLPADLRVLVVENDASTRELIGLLLPDTYAVDDVSSAPAARDAIAAQSYDAVLMDIDLNGSESGVDLMRALPENKLDATPVLAVTAYAMPGDREKMLNAGFDGYLAKPFTKDQFLRAFARLFEQDGHQPPTAET